MKDVIFEVLSILGIVIIVGLIFSPLFYIEYREEIVADKCGTLGAIDQFGKEPICNSRENYCYKKCRYLLDDLVDTWGVETSNQDILSRSALECLDKCNSFDIKELENE